ncbi:MAG: hypothetical protein JO089_06125 [Alphaproteobacteria bacterium]|nr:hypothetical protein [Alphaproteobacteria bacterium]
MPLPPTLLCAAGAQLITAVIWATALDARVGVLESVRADARGVPEKLARLEERVDAIRQDVAFIRRALERK